MRQEPLLFEDFHLHWCLIRDRAPLHLLEPRRIEPKVKSSLPASSTKREPSEFEVVEVAQAVQAAQVAQAAQPTRAKHPS